MLAVSLLVCAMLALIEAAAHPDAVAGSVEWKPSAIQEGKKAQVKIQTYCPGGWTGYSGRCFRYIPTTMTWAQAEKNCQSMGANLASVHSAEEYHEIQKIIFTFTYAYGVTWIGGSDAQEEGIWFWSDGSAFNYRHCGGFDNYKRRQHCLQMNYGGNNCWDDVECYNRLPSVCAKKH